MSATQQLMNLRLPAGDYVTAKDISAATGFSERTIQEAIGNDKIGAFALNGQTKKGAEKITRKRIPREHAIIYMIKCANFDADSLASDIYLCLDKMPLEILVQVQSHIVQLIKRGHRR